MIELKYLIAAIVGLPCHSAEYEGEPGNWSISAWFDFPDGRKNAQGLERISKETLAEAAVEAATTFRPYVHEHLNEKAR